MKKLIVGLVIGLMVGAILGSALSAKSAVQPTLVQPKPPTIAQLLTLVNAERAKHGVAPLKEDARLDASAQLKANDEVAYNYFGHFRDGKFVGQDFIDATGINCPNDSENLAWNADKSNITASQAMTWWDNSKPHHDAIIDARYTLTGFGIVNDAIVEHFCQQ